MRDRDPILVGVGQITTRDADPRTAPSPVAAMAAAARLAEEDAATRGLLARVDSVRCVHVLSWNHGDLPGLLAEHLELTGVERVATPIGGNSPQLLVSETAEELAAGTRDVVLLAGAEAMRTVALAQKQDVVLDWPRKDRAPDREIGDDTFGSSAIELAHGATAPSRIYPIFENALRAARGWTLEEHRRQLGVSFSRLSRVAAKNPHAWFPTERSAEELVTPGPDNRMIAFPYPKLLNAIMAVDQAAAVLMTTAGRARELGIPRDRWVYVHGVAEAHDPWIWSERAELARSVAIEQAGAAALAQAGCSIGDVARLDLYSCFPCAPRIAADALGIADADPRERTVTGGLPYFGGPGNDYVMHAIATMVERLRADPEALGLVNGVGWYLTKHAVGVYAARPPETPWRRLPSSRVQEDVDRRAETVEVASAPQGRCRVEGYTVVHARDGAPKRGIVVGRLDDGRRFLANAPEDRSVLEAMESREAIGEVGRVAPGDPVNRWEPGGARI